MRDFELELENSSLEDLDYEIKKTLLESHYLREYYEIYFSDDDNIYLEKGLYNNIDITKMTIDARKKYKKAMKSAKKNIKNKNYKEAARDIDEAITYVEKIDDLIANNTKDGIAMYATGFGIRMVIETIEYLLILYSVTEVTGNIGIAMIPAAVLTAKKWIDELNFLLKKLIYAKRTNKYGIPDYADKSNYNLYKNKCRQYLMKYINSLKKLKAELNSKK